ncbi:MAG: carboxymuconolactone decarboxylase family protein [bacterium]
MARLEVISTETMTEEQKEVYAKTRPGQTGTVHGPAGPWQRSPQMYERLGWMIPFMRDDSEIPGKTREFAILLTVILWNSMYPFKRHHAAAIKNGVEQDLIDALERGERPQFKDTNDETIYDFCIELRENKFVSNETYNKALDFLGEKGLVEFVGLIGLYTSIAFTVNVFEVPVID